MFIASGGPSRQAAIGRKRPEFVRSPRGDFTEGPTISSALPLYSTRMSDWNIRCGATGRSLARRRACGGGSGHDAKTQRFPDVTVGASGRELDDVLAHGEPGKRQVDLSEVAVDVRRERYLPHRHTHPAQ